jgi:adenosylmethionine-8-amino-7-oxononanoate aminotransferase
MKDNFWRPFTQEALADKRIKIKSAKDAYLYDINKKKYIDFVSSWWTINHGHCNVKIVKAICKQVKKLDHIIAADLSNDASELVIKELMKYLDQSLSKFFFSDNGSTAVEVAMKIVYQYWFNKGQKKKYFITFKKGYHGDTLGAMSLGYSSDFFRIFNDIIYQDVITIDFPETWENDINRQKKEDASIDQFKDIIKDKKDDIICLFIEPLIQGAAGMLN